MAASAGRDGVDVAMRRSLDLLWGAEPERRRGRKPQAASADVIRVAITLADAEGLGAVSMRRIAEDLGVTAMAIYSHVPSKSALVDAMLDQVFAEVRQAEHQPAADWRSSLRQSALRTRDMYLRHPWTLQISAARRPFGPNLLACLEADLRIVSGLGLSARDMVSIVNTVDYYVHGATASSLETAKDAQGSTLSDADWFTAHGEMLGRYTDFTSYPTLVSLWEAGALTGPSRDFDFGLDRILDGIQDHVEALAERPDPP